MVHVALLLVDADGVEHLVHARHAERGDVEHLGLAPLEQARAVRRRQDADLGRQRAQVGGPRPSMRTPSSTMRLRTSFLVSDRTAALISFSRPSNSAASSPMMALVASSVAALRSALWVIVVTLAKALGADRRHPGEHVVAVVVLRLVGDRRVHAGLLDQLALQLDRLADPGLGLFEALGDDLLGDLGGAGLVVPPGVLGAAGLDHHDGDVAVDLAAGDDQLEGRVVAFLVGRVGDPLALGGVGDAHGADGALEGDAREHQRRRRGVDGEHVVGVLLVGAHDGADDLGLVAVAVGERRAQGPVDQPAGEDGLVGRAGPPGGRTSRGSCRPRTSAPRRRR